MTSPIFIDFETRSCVDLRKTGAWRYAEDPTTDVLCLCWGLDHGPIRTWYPGQPIPLEIAVAAAVGGKFVAHNAEFERAIWKRVLAPRYGFPEPELDQWECSAGMAQAMALPRSLEDAARAMGLPVQKDQQGHALMLRVSRPRSFLPNGTPVWWTDTDKDKLQRLAAYCAQDVEVTRQLYPHLLPLSADERAVWLLDAKMNERGVYIDEALVRAARKVVTDAEDALLAELVTLTRGAVKTVKQVAKLKDWLSAEGCDVNSLDKSAVSEALSRPTLTASARRALEIRQELALSSTGKLDAMLSRRCADGRARGNLIYHAATTGRWAGTGIQLQNLPRGTLPKGVKALDCLSAIRLGDYRLFDVLFNHPPLGVVSSCIRSMITAAPGMDLAAADFANIEGRVLAWVAGEGWKIQAFRAYDTITGYDAKGEALRAGPDLYKLAYSKSFNVPVPSVTSDQRQIGKVQELALGYQGGVGAFQSMAVLYGIVIADAVADQIKVLWRKAHPATVQLWEDMETAAISAIAQPLTVFRAGAGGCISFACSGGFLWMRLPSGRKLSYPAPALDYVKTKFGTMKRTITFAGVNEHSRMWGRNTTYGGKLTENAVQAIARDLMAEALLRIESKGWPCVLSVHDEAVAEVPAGTFPNDDPAPFEAEMARLPAWASGLPVAASGWVGERYRKG
jgi:DNA polymerase